jgi:uncharacterized membrane protein YcaP (DUF421 family)
MKKEDIHLDDLKRIFIGQAPLEFMLEVIIRTAIIYLLLLVVMRLLGKRMNAQLSVTEMAVMITMGAIIAVPAQIPERGILPSLVVLLCVLALQRGLSWWSFRQRGAEVTLQGDVDLLVKDGVIQLDKLQEARVSHQQLFGQIRAHDLVHLGQVKRLYLEGGGHFSIFKNKHPKPGLSTLPEKDAKLHDEEPRADSLSACLYCGYVVKPTATMQPCPNCDHNAWTYAVQADPQVVQA